MTKHRAGDIEIPRNAVKWAGRAVLLIAVLGVVWLLAASTIARGLTSRAQTLADDGAYERAMGLYNTALFLHRDYAEAYKFRAFSHNWLGDYEAALADFEQANELDPRDPVTLVWLGHTHYNLGDPEAAIPAYQEAALLDDFEQELAAYYGLGLAFGAVDNMSAAIEYHTLSVMLQEDAGEISAPYYYYALGNALNAAGEYSDAFRAYTEYTQHASDPAVLSSIREQWFNRGTALSDAGEHANAVEYFTRAIEMDPAYFDAYRARGFAYTWLDEPTAARADFRRAAELRPDDPDMAVWTGHMEYQLDNLEAAQAAFRRAVSLGARMDGNYGLGLVYNAQGNYERAIDAYTQAIAVQEVAGNIEHPFHYYVLGQALWADGQQEAARVAYGQYLQHAGENADPAIVAELQTLR